MDNHTNEPSSSEDPSQGQEDARKKFDEFMSMKYVSALLSSISVKAAIVVGIMILTILIFSVDPFENWKVTDYGQDSSSDEEWNPPSRDTPSVYSDSDSDGSQIQDAFLQSDEDSEESASLDTEAIIARRTRARAPLTNVQLADLEGTSSYSSYALGIPISMC